MPFSDVSRNHPMAELDDAEREEIALHMQAREAIARCLADVEDCPEPEHYSLADDVLLALDNADIRLTRNA